MVSGALYSYTEPECQIETDIFHPDLRVADEAVTAVNELHLTFRSVSSDQINFTGVEIGDGDIEQAQTLTLELGETAPYEVAEGEPVDCAEAEITVFYDIGVVENQQLSGTLQLPLQLVEAVIELLNPEGDTIKELKIDSNIRPVDQDICIGDQCAHIENIDDEEIDEGVAQGLTNQGVEILPVTIYEGEIFEGVQTVEFFEDKVGCQF